MGYLVVMWLVRGGEGLHWMELAVDRGRWRALVNEVINLRVT
jgi:hypothetical protein